MCIYALIMILLKHIEITLQASSEINEHTYFINTNIAKVTLYFI